MNRSQTAPGGPQRTGMWMYHNLNGSMVAGVPRIAGATRNRVSIQLLQGPPIFMKRSPAPRMTLEIQRSPLAPLT